MALHVDLWTTGCTDALSNPLLVGGPALAGPFCAARPGTMALLVLDARPREIVVLGRRDGAVVEPATGVRLVEAPAEARSPAES